MVDETEGGGIPEPKHARKDCLDFSPVSRSADNLDNPFALADIEKLADSSLRPAPPPISAARFPIATYPQSIIISPDPSAPTFTPAFVEIADRLGISPQSLKEIGDTIVREMLQAELEKVRESLWRFCPPYIQWEDEESSATHAREKNLERWTPQLLREYANTLENREKGEGDINEETPEK